MTQPAFGKERTALLDWLGNHRKHVLGILAGLPDDALRRAVLPSGWTCLGLVRHLAVDVERFWFRGVAAGEAIDFNDSTGWQPSPDEPAGAVLELYRQEIKRADAILAVIDLDAPPVTWPEYFTDWHLDDVRGIILHVIGETAVHAGHLDAVRELIDGRTWLGEPVSRVPRD
ncbi:MAG: DinB family protein [Nocardiopsaceae bacterium]|jgi:hypothetical protein|nr:DinB family protein [Nocardiopsaceae bacterium]